MKLYGTTTSPFVRRVCVVAAEVSEPIERVDTAPEVGQQVLRAMSPIRKVPVVEIDGRVLYDSHVIIEYIAQTRGWGTLAAPVDPWRLEHNVVSAIDAAQDSILQLFLLRRDGIAIDGTLFAQRQLDRTAAIFDWLGTQLAADGTSFSGGFGLCELALIAMLDWMDFRQSYPTARAGAVARVREAWRDRPSLVETRPHD